MGRYLICETQKFKADWLIQNYAAEKIEKPPEKFEDIPAGKVLIAILHNSFFDAALWIWNPSELAVVKSPADRREKEYLLIEKSKAYELSGINPEIDES